MALRKTRNFATPRAPKVAPTASAAGKGSNPAFTLDEIPLSAFEAVIARNGDAFSALSAEKYYRHAETFVAAIKNGASPSAVTLPASDAIPAETLHQLACIMRQVRGPRSADALATALWASASALGHRAATLSLARQLIRSGSFGRLPPLRPVEDRFRRLVDAPAAPPDADALTAQGELLFELGRFEAAVSTLRRALQVGAAGFEWRPHCELCLGKALLKLGRRDEATTVLEALAEAGLSEADMELGQMLRGTDRERAEQHLYAAACNGRRDLFSHLSEMALEQEGSAEDRRRWAMEWSRLADSRAEY
ncbi:tetratricopeptide repeat protein [Purpureocillium lavendulum]|uniref:Tetratricopeptide repeat protein n=1 Tax=Purpureocillium lavendulum TaxID=1247861 RepID=A0AB34G6R6_9HYPO|nr:tetratricopeptide repeat protein [Purpureocillium lavendulum]